MSGTSRRALLGAGLLVGAGTLSACGSPADSVCLEGDQAFDSGGGLSIPFIGAETHLRSEPQLGLLGLAVSPDGTRVAAHEWWHRRALSESETAGTTIWDTATGEIVTRFDDTMTGAIAWHPQEDLIATAGELAIHLTRPDGEVLWTLGGHEESDSLRSRTIRDLAFSPDGGQLASLSTDGTIRLWTLAEGSCTTSPVLHFPSGTPMALAYTQDGSQIAVAVREKGAELWDARTGDRATTLEGCSQNAVGLALDGQGRIILGVGEEGRLQPASPGSGCEAGIESGISVPEYIAAGPEGRIAVSGGESESVELWDADLAEHERIDLPEFIPDIGAPGELGRTAWGPDGTLYAVTRWWGVTTWNGQEWAPLEMP